MASVSCSSCGAAIQDWVAEETGGLCRPCVAGAVSCTECGKAMMRQAMLKDKDHVCLTCRKKKTPTTQEVEFNGVMVAEAWPAKVDAAQKVKTLLIDGKRRRRIRYGSEKEWELDFSRPCGDCAVIRGQLHVPQCDSEQCPNCRGQLVSCGCLSV